MPLNMIKQTSKTILFEEFDVTDTADKMTAYLQQTTEGKDGIKRFNDNCVNEIEKHLTVNSFNEFVQKFMPKVWLSTEYSNDDYPDFNYSLKKPHNYATPIQLDKHEFYTMLMEIFDRKSKSGESDFEFDFDIIDNLLSPEKVLKDAEKIRGQYVFECKTYLELEKDGKKKMEFNECKKRIISLRRGIVKQYQNNFPYLLKLALGDVQFKLKELEKNKLNGSSTNDDDADKKQGSNGKLETGYVTTCFDKNGKITTKPAVILSLEEKNTSNNGTSMQSLKDYIKKDFKKLAEQEKTFILDDLNKKENYLQVQINTLAKKEDATEEIQNLLVQNKGAIERIKQDIEEIDNLDNFYSPFVESLIISSFIGEESKDEGDYEAQLIEKRDMYTKVYLKIQNSFTNALSSSLENMLNVKAFFDNATTLKDNKLAAPLIVSNCKITDLLEGDMKEYFTEYLKLMNAQNSPEKIWFSIIPAVGYEDFADETSGDVHLDELDVTLEIDNNDENEIQTNTSLIDIGSLKIALELLETYKIITFFNFKGSEKTSFSNINTEILQLYKKKTESLNGKEYAVFCSPNFTLIPKKNTNIKIGENTDGDVFLEMPGVYIDASYVAAGITVASQNVKILKEIGFNVKENYPCVRFEISDPKNRYKLLTKMNRERNLSWVDEIEQEAFGFFFSGTLKYIDGEKINQSYVVSTKTMDDEGIYVTLVKMFIEMYIPMNGLNNTIGLEKFINVNSNEWVLDSQNKKDLANNIFIEGEGVSIDNSSEVIKVKIKFNDVKEDVELVVESDTNKS